VYERVKASASYALRIFGSGHRLQLCGCKETTNPCEDSRANRLSCSRVDATRSDENEQTER